MELQREISIDILRAIVFWGLVAAHIKPSDFILQLRNFDVPMMVFLSGVVFSLTSSGTSLTFPMSINDLSVSLSLYIIVIIVCVAATYIQHKLVNKFSKHVSPVTSKYARIIFDG